MIDLGEKRLCTIASTGEFGRALPDARLVTVKGAAHASWLDDPVTVFSAIRQFLRGEWPLGAEKPSS